MFQCLKSSDGLQQAAANMNSSFRNWRTLYQKTLDWYIFYLSTFVISFLTILMWISCGTGWKFEWHRKCLFLLMLIFSEQLKFKRSQLFPNQEIFNLQPVNIVQSQSTLNNTFISDSCSCTGMAKQMYWSKICTWRTLSSSRLWRLRSRGRKSQRRRTTCWKRRSPASTR